MDHNMNYYCDVMYSLGFSSAFQKSGSPGRERKRVAGLESVYQPRHQEHPIPKCEMPSTCC